MKKIKIENVLYYITLVLFLIFTLGPIIWCLILSVTPQGELLARNTHILPTSIYLGNYENLLNPDTSGHDALFTGISNSVYTSVITVLVGLPIATMSGYLFAKYKFKGQNIALKFILFTIVIPVFTTIIPIYSIFSEYGILDNLFWISVIYISAFLPINTWIIFNYFRGLPQDLWDAAFIDGCNEVQTFFWVILPVSYPIIITCALMMFLMSWNQFQIPLILTSSQNNKVVTLILSEFMSRDAISYGAIAACGIFSILPPAVVAIIFRRFLVSGLMSGSVKS